MNKHFWTGFEKQSRSLEDIVTEANLSTAEHRPGMKALGARAERELVRNQLGKIKHDIPIGTVLGALAGGAMGSRSSKSHALMGALLGGGVGAWGGAMSGSIRGARGSDAAAIRKKHFGTSDFDEIKRKFVRNLSWKEMRAKQKLNK